MGRCAVKGLMQDEQLTLTSILERGVALFPASTIATLTGGGTHRESFEEFGGRVARLAGALRELGVRPGDRVASFAWNHWRHAELYFAVPCVGAVLHTVNIRLHPDQVAWILRDAGSNLVFVDDSLADRFDEACRALPSRPLVVSMREQGADGPGLDYDELVAAQSPDVSWPALKENDACGICYTSGTTGNPKGVVYSHRSMVLHALMINQAGVYGLTDRDVVLPLVPMFHANCWGLPHAAVMAGTSMVFTGSLSADPAAIVAAIEDERVTIAGAVPSVWVTLLAHLEDHPADLSSLRAVASGGAHVTAALIREFDERFGIEVWQGWGMTETSPLGTFSRLPKTLDGLTRAETYRARAKQGRPVPGIRLRVVGAQGEEVPRDGATSGELQARGPWVAGGYLNVGAGDSFDGGWFRTGDVATVDEHGFIEIVDRTKDLVKSGGEWISSLQLEAALVEHPAIREAAVVAAPDERWGERPVAYVVLQPQAEVSEEELLGHLRERFPSWWLPDAVVRVPELPKTSVGKIDKRRLRESAHGFIDAPSLPTTDQGGSDARDETGRSLA